VVFPDGTVECLLSEDKVSNGVQGYNSTSINIAYVGGIDSRGRGIDNRTDDQKRVLRDLLGSLKKRYPNAHIMGHRDIWGKNPKNWKKQCPCFDAEAEYANIGKKEEPAPIVMPLFAQPEEPKQSIWSKIKSYFPWNKQ
jgi:N-acetylmuramoyl-L-alanine amidase